MTIEMNVRIFIFLITAVLLSMWACSPEPQNVNRVSKTPVIDPDYSNLLLPPNIAPINFRIVQKGEVYRTTISGGTEQIIFQSKSNLVRIPMKKWKRLLALCRGDSISIEISVKTDGQHWQKFDPIINHIAEQPIDSHVAYRLINPGYTLWWELGLYQRDITTFDEQPIFTNRLTKHNCMNCHAFCQNDPGRMMFHMRADLGGTMFVYDDTIEKVDTKTDYTMSAGVYPAWHPGGRHVAFSVNKIYQKFHAHRDKSLYVYDMASDLVIYDIESRQITTSPQVSTSRLENFPNWHPNGKDLYFISSQNFDSQTHYDSVFYDLMQITFDVESNTWGEVSPVITSQEIGGSVTMPKVSPSGRFLVFTLSDYGYFTIHNTSSDLWLYDLQEDRYRKLEVNSDHVDSYHSWSSDGYWMVFSSKRRDELCARLYFCHINERGEASKPFLLPQKDPAFYDTYLLNYNVPEMVSGPIKIDRGKLARKARLDPVPAAFDSTVQIDALSGASKIVVSGSKPYL